MKIRRFCAILIGLVFLASGLLKLLDPVGTGLIVSEYFKFFHLGFLQGTAKALGMALSLVEAATGAALISGVFRKTTAFITSLLVVFFTIITLILWIAKPEMDCGCFGEAIHLSHGQCWPWPPSPSSRSRTSACPGRGSTWPSSWPFLPSSSRSATTPGTCR